jgi:hypothetical protein
VRTPSRRLSALFGIASLGVLLAGGLLAAELGGLPALLGYAAVVALLLALGVAQVRRLTPPRPAARPACTCCGPSSAGDHTGPVTVR